MKSLHYLLLVPVLLFLSSCQNNMHYDTLAGISAVLIVLIIVMFVALAVKSNILRDEISNCDEFDKNLQKMQQRQKVLIVDKSAPYNLTKVQFGVWTVIIASSYIYLSLMKGDCAEGPINKTALVLMGIFAGTAVAASIIDKGEINDSRPRHQNRPSQGFFMDMLSDDNGISLHRFQNFVWTVIAMTVYIYKVYGITNGCVLPELGDTLLALTGISSATYLVMKTKENDPAVLPDAPKANTAPSLISSPGTEASTIPQQPTPAL